MNLYEYLKLPTKNKLIFCHQIRQDEIDLDPDVKLISDIFINLIDSCRRRNIDLVTLLNNNDFNLPSKVEKFYEYEEDSVLSNLPYNKYQVSHHKFSDLKSKIREENRIEKQRIFEESKQGWFKEFPDFAEISSLFNLHSTNNLLIEFGTKSIPDSLFNSAFDVFKKTISFKTSTSNKKLMKGLTSSKYPHRNYNYCINENIAHKFQDEFLDWGIEISRLWNAVYYSKEDFFKDSGYDRTTWETYIRYPSMLKQKKEEIERQTNKAICLMNSGFELIEKQNFIITQEYEQNRKEMSLYERELEIFLLNDLVNENDEQYCYVYTLECDLFVFYVGIASDTKARYEQHIRGAFSNESHLFKSKFIQKYQNEIRQNIIFEGTRRECKEFERDYILRFSPLGNMTEGGEG